MTEKKTYVPYLHHVYTDLFINPSVRKKITIFFFKWLCSNEISQKKKRHTFLSYLCVRLWIFFMINLLSFLLVSNGKSADNCLVFSCRQDKLLKDFSSYMSTLLSSNMRTDFDFNDETFFIPLSLFLYTLASCFYIVSSLFYKLFLKTHFICIPNCVCFSSLLIFCHFVLLLFLLMLLIMWINTKNNNLVSCDWSMSLK